MARIAVVQQSDNVCVNVIVAELNDPAPEGYFFVDVDYIWCDIGWIYDPVIGDFINPNPSPSVDEIVTDTNPPPSDGGVV